MLILGQLACCNALLYIPRITNRIPWSEPATHIATHSKQYRSGQIFLRLQNPLCDGLNFTGLSYHSDSKKLPNLGGTALSQERSCSHLCWLFAWATGDRSAALSRLSGRLEEAKQHRHQIYVIAKDFKDHDRRMHAHRWIIQLLISNRKHWRTLKPFLTALSVKMTVMSAGKQ